MAEKSPFTPPRSSMTPEEKKRTRTRVIPAFLLSIFCCGIGHLYLGHTRKGLIFFSAVPLHGILNMWGTPVLYLVGNLLLLISWLAALITIIPNGRRPPVGKQGFYNQWWFCLLVVVGLFGFRLSGGFQNLNTNVKAFTLPTTSMSPTLRLDDQLMFDMTAYHSSLPQRGDVVVFRFPGDPSQFWVKRVVGLPGDQVQVDDGALTINGEAVALSETDQAPFQELMTGSRVPTAFYETLGDKKHAVFLSPSGEFVRKTLSENAYFLLGDYRCNSYDSRSFGPVSRDAILGRLAYIVCTDLSRIGPFDESAAE